MSFRAAAFIYICPWKCADEWVHFVHVQAAAAGGKEKVQVTPSMTLAHMTQLIMPQHANSLGITFGGQVLPL